MSCLALTVAFSAYTLAHTAIYNQPKEQAQPNITIHNEQPTVEGDGELSAEFTKGYDTGTHFITNLLDVAMYDLYRTHDVLDFESHSDNLSNRMRLISENEEYQQEVLQAFEEYKKGE